MTDEPELLTVAQAAKLLKVSGGTIYALCRANKLTHYRIGTGRGTVRIERKALDAMLRAGKQERTPEPGRVTLDDVYRAAGRERGKPGWAKKG